MGTWAMEYLGEGKYPPHGPRSVCPHTPRVPLEYTPLGGYILLVGQYQGSGTGKQVVQEGRLEGITLNRMPCGGAPQAVCTPCLGGGP